MTTVVNDLVSVLDNGLDIQAAADAPRFHHQYLPDTLYLEPGFAAETVGLFARVRRLPTATISAM